MKVKNLIDILQSDLDADVLIQVKVSKEENGFKHTANAWVPLEEKHLVKPPFGAKQIFIGQT